MTLLTKEFLSKYKDFPEHMNELSTLVFYRTYSRWLDKEKRRETWKEAVLRAVEYNVQIGIGEFVKNDFDANPKKFVAEAETLFDNIYNLRQFLSGRTHWVGGADTKVADKFPLSNFNCSFINVKSWDDIGDLFYMLLIGTGVGLKCTKEYAKKLAPIRIDLQIIHEQYTPMVKEERLENTKVTVLDNGYAIMYVGDSKEGWVEALSDFFNILTSGENIHTLKISYNSIRPKGERLATFGGTASGHESLRDMFMGIEKVIHGTIDHLLSPLEKATIMDDENNEYELPNMVQLRPVHILDIANLIGNNVVVGGVRRTAEIFLCDADDWESILAKYGINGLWNEQHHEQVIEQLHKLGVGEWACKLKTLPVMDANARPMHHRRMSNNSVAFTTKPSRDMLNLIFTIMQGEGEPGFVNLESAGKRRPNAEGLNPCAEILLDSYGVCNLTTINVTAFVNDDGILDYQGLMQAQALSVRAGIRMTCLDLELPHWDKVQKRDRLVGASLTGWKDAMEMLSYSIDQESNLLSFLADVARNEASKYSYMLRITTPLLITTVKPEGTLSQVAGGVSPGLHMSHSPYYIRRIRINSSDPLAKTVKELGWRISPEVGTEGSTLEEQMQNARTIVVDFPVKSGSTKTKNDVNAKEQLETYFNFQGIYTEHNSSNTISVKPDEWDEVQQIIWDRWDEFVGVSFLAHDGGSYPLAPYEECTEEEYEALKSSMKPFDTEVLRRNEAPELSNDLEGVESCDSGVCPVR